MLFRQDQQSRSIGLVFQRAVIFLCMIWQALPAAGSETQDSPDQKQISFRDSILPILETHCFQCHSSTDVKGDLRLDLESEALKGGHSGNKILGNQPEESELFLRITSNEAGYRMPKEGPLLNESEIGLIRKWIEQGSRWTDTSANSPAPAKRQLVDVAGDWLNQFESAMKQPRFRYASFIAIPAVVWFLVLIFGNLNRRRAARRSSEQVTVSRRRRFGGHLAVVFLLIAAAAILYQWGLIEQLQDSNDQLTAKLESKSNRYSISNDLSKLTVPPYPMHPKRLGGVYYRGNDERSPHLFNGGFYRTATLAVDLVDEDDDAIQWHDEVSNRPLFVRFVIERAPGTTQALFNKRVLDSIYLRHFPKELQTNERTYDDFAKIRLAESIPGEKWEVRIPVGAPSGWRGNIADGLIYIYYGQQMIAGQQGRVHFGIKYFVEMDGPQVSPNSEIWMGSLYNLGGRVLVPDDKTVLLDRWFDFRPIPEIEGTNTADPRLLGIPEHIQN